MSASFRGGLLGSGEKREPGLLPCRGRMGRGPLFGRSQFMVLRWQLGVASEAKGILEGLIYFGLLMVGA